jgi:prefoldin subunit 5
MLKFERTNEKEKAGIIVVVKELEEPIAGATNIAVTRDSVEIEIDYDCDIAGLTPGSTLTVVLHELYHALGLGHPDIGNDYELMGGADLLSTKPAYPTSLDALALWEVWFSGKYDGPPPNGDRLYFAMFSTNLPYVSLVPYSEQLVEMFDREKSYKSQIEEYRKINQSLQNDIKTLEAKVGEYEARIKNLTAINEALRNETEVLKNTVVDLGRKLADREETIGRLSDRVSYLSNELSNATTKIARLESQVGDLEAANSSLESENELLRARIDSLQWILLVLVVTFVCTAVSLAVVWRTRKK